MLLPTLRVILGLYWDYIGVILGLYTSPHSTGRTTLGNSSLLRLLLPMLRVACGVEITTASAKLRANIIEDLPVCTLASRGNLL